MAFLWKLLSRDWSENSKPEGFSFPPIIFESGVLNNYFTKKAPLYGAKVTCSPFLPLPFTPILREETLHFPDKYKRKVKGVMEAMKIYY